MGKFSDEFMTYMRGKDKIWCEKYKFKIPKYLCSKTTCKMWVGNGGICFAN